jgi:hypothetical protein
MQVVFYGNVLSLLVSKLEANTIPVGGSEGGGDTLLETYFVARYNNRQNATTTTTTTAAIPKIGIEPDFKNVVGGVPFWS